MWKRWAFAVLLVAGAAVPVAAAPPPEAEAAARRDLAAQYGSSSLGSGYQVVSWDPKRDVVVPYAHWAFFVGYPDRPYMKMLVAEEPDGWKAVAFSHPGSGHYLPASEALAVAAAKGLQIEGEPRFFQFAQHQFWLLEARGESYFYPTVPGDQQMLVRQELTPAKPVMRKLARLGAWYNGPAVFYVSGLLMVVVMALLIWWIQRRRTSH